MSSRLHECTGTYLGGIGAQTGTGNTALIKIEPGVEAGFEQPLAPFLMYRRLRLPKRGVPIASRRSRHPGWVLLGEDRVTRRAYEKQSSYQGQEPGLGYHWCVLVHGHAWIEGKLP